MPTKFKIITLVIVIMVLVSGLIYYFNQRSKSEIFYLTPLTTDQSQRSSGDNHMILTSPAFASNQFIPVNYTCDGKNVNPALMISDVPVQARSLALIVDDPDAPGGNFTHWLVWNIDPTVDSIIEDGLPSGAVQGLNDAKQNTYFGPCPPNGIHHYHFKLYALDQRLELDTRANKVKLESAINEHIIKQTELVGLYSR